MRTIVVTPPEPVLSWDQVRAHLRLEADDDRQAYVMGLAAAAQGHIDGPDGWLGRAIGVQTLEAYLDSFECGSIRLPFPPTIDVISVTYLNDAGDLTVVASDQYELLGASLVPVFGVSWPTPRWQREAVRVRYRAGYAPVEVEDAEPVSTVPAAIQVAIGLMVQGLFEERSIEEALKGPAEMLLQSHRVFA